MIDLSILDKLANKKRAFHLQRFFKTGPGQYGEGDIFLGINVPQQREVANLYNKSANYSDISLLLKSSFHEYRLVGLLILVRRYEEEDKNDNKELEKKNKEKIFNFYLKYVKAVNSWDLVDLSAPKVIGRFLFEYGAKTRKDFLMNLAVSSNMWKRRIAMVSTYYLICQGEYKETLFIAQNLLNDREDLIHKAVGWMLRELGKRGGHKELLVFLDKYATIMPRTALRYSLERLSDGERRHYMALKASN